MKISAYILYAQLLTHAGYAVRQISELVTTRGSGVFVYGDIARDGTRLASVCVKERDATFVIESETYTVKILDGGQFELVLQDAKVSG